MKQQTKIRILLADDHPLVLEGIKSCLSTHDQFEIVGQAYDVEDAMQKAQQFKPDVIVANLAMREMDPFNVARDFRRAAPQAKLLILPMSNQEQVISQLIQCGVSGYLRKTSPPTDLGRAIERVHRGETFFEPEDARIFLERYIQDRAERAAQVQNRSLSPREYEVLICVGAGLANKEIAERLCLSVRTVEKHRQRMMNKLGIHKATELVKFTIAQGLVTMEAPASNIVFPRVKSPFSASDWGNARAAC